jgi:predicted lipase
MCGGIAQGSYSLESWRTNLAFDPTAFEDPALGVHVHRGVYEAALALYPRIRAIVEEHLASSPYARVSFTGHSLGGSIAMVLALMLLHRQVLRAPQLGPIYTFGAAACFCEADSVAMPDDQVCKCALSI